MRYALIKKHPGRWPVALMAEVLAVSVSGFYDGLMRPKSKRAKEDVVLTEKIMFHWGSEIIGVNLFLPGMNPVIHRLTPVPQGCCALLTACPVSTETSRLPDTKWVVSGSLG